MSPSTARKGALPRTAFIASHLVLMIAVFLCAGCEQYHRTDTGWIKQQTPYATTIVELIEDDGNGRTIDLGAALAADFTATGFSMTKGDLIVTADEIGANRSVSLEAMAENIRAMNERMDRMNTAIESIAAIVNPIPKIPIPEGP